MIWEKENQIGPTLFKTGSLLPKLYIKYMSQCEFIQAIIFSKILFLLKIKQKSSLNFTLLDDISPKSVIRLAFNPT